MPNLAYLNEGDIIEVKGSGKSPYKVRKIGGVVDCSCPAWRNLGGTIDNRVCKHIRLNVDPTCLLPQAQAAMGFSAGSAMPVPALPAAPRLTKTGKVSTAVGGAIVKDTAPPCLLAHKWDGEDPAGWWMSEKMDGVRAWWDGENFISRLGNTYHAPEWFKAKMPATLVLDGELWVGRKMFQTTVSTVRKLIPTDSEWENVHYAVFDGPEIAGDFENRLTALRKVVSGNRRETVYLLKQTRCLDVDHLKRVLRDIEEEGGEGVMLRKAGSLYEEGRSSTCLKVKSFLDDEAKVIGYTDGKGKHKNRVGALICEWNDVTVEVGTGLSDKQRENPPALGSKITFRYFETTVAGIPRFPVFLTARDYE
jgi:DNA ligase-1